jgi:hypothetical protein
VRSMINSRSIWARLAMTWKKKRPAGVFVSIPFVVSLELKEKTMFSDRNVNQNSTMTIPSSRRPQIA